MRLSTGVLREQIMLDFQVDASMFGSLSGYYYLGYGLSQIPFGLLLDRFSYRIIASLAILCTAIGALLFATTSNWQILLLSRFLIGFGSGIGFLSVAKITKACFDEKYHSMLIGFAFTLGLIGAVFSTTPLVILFEHYGHKQILLLVSFVAFSMSIITYICGKNNLPQSAVHTNNTISQSLFRVFTNYRIILIGIAGGLLVGSLEGFADVWAMPFFNQIFGYSIVDSSKITMYVYFGMCLGGPILVFFSNLFGSEYWIIIATAVLTIFIFIILFICNDLSMLTLGTIMFVLGILCCYQVLIFNIASNIMGSSSTGLVISAINCMNMSFGYIFHLVIGQVFVYNWDGLLSEHGTALYLKKDFIRALSTVPICAALGIIIFMFLLKKSDKNQL
ncbi:MAG: MFS transporter [Rickettsiaceae bacterium]|nr:MFS transporter [Rickettsiaceae bacterium]